MHFYMHYVMIAASISWIPKLMMLKLMTRDLYRAYWAMTARYMLLTSLWTAVDLNELLVQNWVLSGLIAMINCP